MAVSLAGARVLVTGGSGMVGSFVVDKLLAVGAARVLVVDKAVQQRNLAGAMASGRVEVVEADIRDTAALRAAAGGTDAIVHLAALLMLQARQDPRVAFEVNTAASHDLLQLAVETGVRRFIFASSVGVYGAPPDDQVITESTPFLCRSLYGASKVAVELYCRAFHDMYGLEYTALRLGTVYGPRLHGNGFFPRFILSVLDQVDRGEVPVVEGRPGELHDFVYAVDVADAVVRAVAAEQTDVALNIVSGVPVTLAEVFGTLLDLYGAPGQIDWKPRSISYVERRRFSGALAEQILGFRAATDLRAGLQTVIDWRRETRARTGR